MNTADIKNGYKIIKTSERLYLRRFTAGDIGAFSALIRDKAASPMAQYDSPYPTDDEGLLNLLLYFIRSGEFLAVILKDTDALIGFVSLNNISDTEKNLGYCIHTAEWGHGYATEAAGAAISYARESGVLRLVSGTAKENLPSRHVLEKLGFSAVGGDDASDGLSYELIL